MVWLKRGRIYVPDGRTRWAAHSALTPTPIVLNEATIRVYVGFRDETGVSRIGFVDLDSGDPSKIIKVSHEPVLDVGQNGCFDDNGVILGDVVRVGNKIYMYYVGFQLAQKVKFLAFTGLAISADNGDSFGRYSEAPVMDRSDEGLYFRAIHSVIIEDGIWKFWYGVGSKWSHINGTMYPNYIVRYVESADGINFPSTGQICIDQESDDEYRIGRPRVCKFNDGYRMFYTVGTLSGTYLPGYAESKDGKFWTRVDRKVGISPSLEGWDSKSLSYIAPLRVRNKEYLFYNGNEMGKTGFGYAERVIKERKE